MGQNSLTGGSDVVDTMRDRDEQNAAYARARAAKPAMARSAEERLREAIEDDEVREALRIPRRRKSVAEGGT